MSTCPECEKRQADLDRLTAERDYYRNEYRRTAEELDFRDEKIRVLNRVIERLGGANKN